MSTSKWSRRAVVSGAAAGVLAAATGPSRAQATWPSAVIRLVVPFPPGGGADLTARLLAQHMGEALGQSIIVENKPGANGAVGADSVAKSAPDGHTLLLIDRGALALNPHVAKALPYDPVRSFEPIGIVSDGPYVLVVNPALGARSLGDLIAIARSRELTYASFGFGSMAHYNIEDLAARSGVKLVHVPHRGAGPAALAVVKNDVALTIASPPSVLDFIAEGKLIALAVGAPNRLPQLPNVPTLVEAGGPIDGLVPTYFALLAPARTPAPIVTKLNVEMAKAVARKDVGDVLAKSGLIANGGSPGRLADTIAADMVRFGERVRVLGIKAE